MWQEWRVLYTKTYAHLWQELAEFFLQWEMLQTKVVEEIKTHFMYNNFPHPPKSYVLRDNVENMMEPNSTHMAM
jgi:hypothetical protein